MILDGPPEVRLSGRLDANAVHDCRIVLVCNCRATVEILAVWYTNIQCNKRQT
jgi:hypothetical protein